MKRVELEYSLPPELIAQHPAARRDESSLLVLRSRERAKFRHRRFRDLPDELAGELVVVNDTRVVPARLRLQRPGGGDAEVLAARAAERRRGVGGSRAPDAAAEARAAPRAGRARSSTWARAAGACGSTGSRTGEAPLPPYITEPLADPERYQTVYAEREGSAAAPDRRSPFHAGAAWRGLDVERVTLHVGLDTFRPVTADDLADHRDPQRALRGRARGVGAHPRGRARARGRDDDRSRARVARPRSAARPAAPISSSRPASSSAAPMRC